MFGIAGALHGDLRDSAVDVTKIFGRQHDRGRANILFQTCCFVVPGIGTIQGFCAKSQPSPISAGVAACLAEKIDPRARFACRTSGVKRGPIVRKSLLSK
jgi:hypothetical protein